MTKNKQYFEVKEGSVVVKVYYAPIKGKENWCVSWIGPDGRERKNRATKAGAEKVAKAVADQLINGRMVEMQPAQVAEYRDAVERLHAVDMTLPQAVSEMVSAKKLFSGSIVDAASIAARMTTCKAKTVADAVDEFLAFQEGQNGDRHYIDLSSRLLRFKEFVQGEIGHVDRLDIEQWLKHVGGGKRSRNNFISALSNLTNWCKQNKYLPESWDNLPKRKRVDSAPADPHSPEEFEKLLRAAEAMEDKRFVVYLALRGFFGIRDAESRRISNSVREAHLVIEGKEGKVNTRRLIPMHGNSKLWIDRYAPKRGLLLPDAEAWFLECVADLFRSVNVPRRHNGLRDGFISYRMAQTQNSDLVADEAGNSPRQVREKYRAILLEDGREITPAIAKMWFDLTPQSHGASCK